MNTDECPYCGGDIVYDEYSIGHCDDCGIERDDSDTDAMDQSESGYE